MSNYYQRGQRKICSFFIVLAEAGKTAFAGKEAELRRQKKLYFKGAALGLVLTALFAQTASATAVVTQKLGSLNDLVLGIVTAAGVIVLAWGIFEFATAYQSHDTSQQTMSLKKVVSGIIMVTAPQIISLLK